MANLRQLKNRIKTFGEFTRVINIQKIQIIREIGEIKDKIDQINFSYTVFNNYMIDLYRKYNVYEPAMFLVEKSRVPKKRNLYFVMANPSSDRLGKYAHRLINEYISKNHTANDIYVVIGRELADFLTKRGINVAKQMSLQDIDDPSIYRRISWQIYRGYSDLMFVEAQLIYLSAIEQRVVSLSIYPFENKTKKLTKHDWENFGSAISIIEEIDLSKVTWRRDLSSVAERIAKLAIELKVYESMIQYRLSLKTRELQSLEDKENNIKSEVERVQAMMQRVRKENITNELITSAVAFSVIGLEDDQPVPKRRSDA
ncbi:MULTISPECIES: F0F1 ATP synthase subunit gamma [unclassified Mycoplasma]|uniref:F0F1 ATP synthase subunit gamma n=1 Tax=unclassified Mycoplasma TaxID=2683645 RepID=UPI001374E9B0